MNTQTEKTKIVEVSAAVLQQPDGTFLLAQRPPDKIWAGYWEFPGGKIEAGETPYHALVRELHEELGIDVQTAYPWLLRVFTYPHATVRLHFFRVTAWSGELHPHEGQQFSWQRAAEAAVAPMLPANAPILRALELPDLYAISNAAELGCEEFMLRLERALQNGLRLLQLREKHLPAHELAAFAAQVVELAHSYSARVLINSDAELAKQVGADGVHYTATQLLQCSGRPALQWCSASCHDAAELRRAGELGFDCALLSPVLPTQSHPGAAHLGWERFAELASQATLPVYALGGLVQDDMQAAWQHGAHGISLLRQAW
ncbi:MAG: Nudix family hydrolase [Nitrosomonadales bacterium]|nr:Nudix family hydrolase [Nitrosomonadales bacterium]